MASSNVSKDPRTTPAVRVSYPTLFTPRAFQPGNDPKYGIVLMFDKSNAEHMAFMKLLHQDCQAALAEKWPKEEERPRVALVGETRSPIKDGDKTVNNNGIPLCEKNPEYAGQFIVRANTASRPAIVDRNMQEILDSNELYGGCFCKVNLNAYTFDMSANKGVTFGLNGVQKWSDGESFGGGRPPLEDMFDAEKGQNDPDNYAPAGGDPFAGAQDTGAPPATAVDDNPFS
jgi:hypothetical protein